MKLPKNKEDRRIFPESNTASYIKEVQELEEDLGIVIDHIYYSDHLGVWCLKMEGIDEEFETKEELLKYLHETNWSLLQRSKF